MSGDKTAMELPILYFSTREDWRTWLNNNSDHSSGVWLQFWKVSSSHPSLLYEDAIEEALCFGWVDSIIKKLDEQSYLRKFTPRTLQSKWSKINLRRVEKMIVHNKMTPLGLEKFNNRNIEDPYSNRPQFNLDLDHLPPAFQNALDHNFLAQKNFEQLSNSHKKQYLVWILTAKREDTQLRRIKQSIELLSKNQPLGLK